MLGPRNNGETGLRVKGSSGHVRKVSHNIRRVSPATVVLQAVVRTAWPNVCRETESGFPSRRPSGRHSAAERDDRPRPSSGRVRGNVRPCRAARRFIAEAKADGFVQLAIERAGMRGMVVGPR
jgi:hypothetical protein